MLFGRQPESQAKEYQFSAGTGEPRRVQSKGEISSVDDFSGEQIQKACRTFRAALQTVKGVLAKGGQVGG